MARKPRIDFPGAFFRIIMRGYQKQDIFRKKSDYRRFLDIMQDYKTLHRFHPYAYVLMSNNVHLLIVTGAMPLAKTIQRINQRYTMHSSGADHRAVKIPSEEKALLPCP